MMNFKFKNAEIRIWINELPSAILGNENSIEIEKGVSGKAIEPINKIGVELYLHRDSSYYGLLGAETVTPFKTDTFLAKVYYMCELNLFFNRGAHCEIGSSHKIFKLVAKIVLKLFKCNKLIYCKEDIQEILDLYLID